MLSRRDFLRVTAQGSAALALVGVSGSLLTACDPGRLQGPDANGLRLLPGFRSRVVGTTGRLVPGTLHVWHPAPDGGACFALPDGGWSYVSNSEFAPGGAGFIRFAADGRIMRSGTCLTGTLANCAGGPTPWGTWLSCEEHVQGQVWECHPTGARLAKARPAMGRFSHEAAAVDVANR